MNQNLYDHPEIKTTNKKFKSVFITDIFSEDCLILEVEANDDIGYNAINTTVDALDTFYDELNEIILENYKIINKQTKLIRVIINSEIEHMEYILTSDGNIY